MPNGADKSKEGVNGGPAIRKMVPEERFLPLHADGFRPSSNGTFDHERQAQFDFREFLSVVYRRRWAVLAVFVLIVLLTFLYTISLTPVFRSRALLELDPESIDSIKNLGESLAQSLGVGDKETYATEAGILQSRSQALALLDRLNIKDSPLLKAPPPGFLVKLRERLAGVFLFLDDDQAAGPPNENLIMDGLIRDILTRVQVNRVGQSRLMEVSMDATNPKVAQKLLTAYIELYLEQNLEKRRASSAGAGQWIRDELSKSEAKLVKSMAAMVDFTNNHGLVSLDEGGNHILQIFNKTAEGLVRSKELRAQMEALEKESAKGRRSVLPSDLTSLDVQQLMQKLSILEADYNSRREIYSEDYPKLAMVRKEIQSLKDQIVKLQRSTVEAAVETARTQEKLQEEAFEKARKIAMDTNSLGVQYAILKKEAETNEHIYKLLLQKNKELELNTQIIGNNVRVVDPPNLPVLSIKPRRTLNMLVGIVLACLGAVASALMLEQLDNKIRSVEDLEKRLQIPVLAAVPKADQEAKAKASNGSGPLELTPFLAPRSLLAEAINNLKTSVSLSLPGGGSKVFLVASSEPFEGKTFISVSMATAFCGKDKRVVVIDCDMRKGRVAKVFGQRFENAPGLSTLLSRSDAKLQDVLYRSKVPQLYYMPSGPTAMNPVGLLESEHFARLLHYLRKAFHYVVLDSPPVLGFSDSIILADSADAVVLVVRQGAVPADMVGRAKSILCSARGVVVGSVLNMASGDASYYGRRYKKYYRYYEKTS